MNDDIEKNPRVLDIGGDHDDDSDNFVKSNFHDKEQLNKQFRDSINTTNSNPFKDQANKRSSRSSSLESRPLDRWPTLFEILNRKTQSPVDLWSFYVYMRDGQKSIDYLDFWMDTVQHMALCKSYVKGLRDSLVVNERVRNAGAITEAMATSSSGNIPQQQQQSSTQQPQQRQQDPVSYITDTSRSEKPTPSFLYDSHKNRDSGASSRDSRSSSMLLDLLMKNNLLEDNDPHRVSSFLRGEGSIRTSDPVVNAKIEELKRLSQVIDMDEQLDFEEDSKRMSKIKPEMVETLIQYDLRKSDKPYEDTKYVSRTSLRKSSRNIMLTYFIQDAKKKLDIPQPMVDRVLHSLEVEGRDDPEVFDEAHSF
ncbi:unnamed protein product [Ambrosiozyma monospora]|uniref:Unnamed protein product n=1 Tax=Ambrosiozyma monospora TaxID=43982 RepID=A0ACB5T7D2_AMBMO|nr:unnamed protein product [Ambrosiozyma monospora]